MCLKFQLTTTSTLFTVTIAICWVSTIYFLDDKYVRQGNAYETKNG